MSLYETEVLVDTPFAFYRMDDTGNAMADSVGSLDGEYLPVDALGSSYIGPGPEHGTKSMYFRPVHNGVPQGAWIPPDTLLDGIKAVEYWVYLPTDGTFSLNLLFGINRRFERTGTYPNYSFSELTPWWGVDRSGPYVFDWWPTVNLSGGSQLLPDQNYVPDANSPAWHHVVISDDGVDTYLYLDGTQVGVLNSTGLLAGNSSAGLMLGGPQDGSTGIGWLKYSGLALYDHNLTSTRVQAHWEATAKAEFESEASQGTTADANLIIGPPLYAEAGVLIFGEASLYTGARFDSDSTLAVTADAALSVPRPLASEPDISVTADTANLLTGILFASEPTFSITVDSALTATRPVAHKGTPTLDPGWHLIKLCHQNPATASTGFSEYLDGTGVDIYIVDSGINYYHEDFTYFRAQALPDFIDDLKSGPSVPDGWDENGHGTLSASLAAGTNSGIARNSRVFSARVFDKDGEGATQVKVMEAVDAIITHHNAKGGSRPSVINASLGTEPSESYPYVLYNDPIVPDDDIMEEAFQAAVDAGIVVVVSAGNGFLDTEGALVGRMNASYVSPARLDAAITVGAAGQSMGIASFSNYGPAVDCFAPGVAVRGADYEGDYDYRYDSGTSFSSPLVAGICALYLQTNPNAAPDEVHDFIVNASRKGYVVGAETAYTTDGVIDSETTLQYIYDPDGYWVPGGEYYGPIDYPEDDPTANRFAYLYFVETTLEFDPTQSSSLGVVKSGNLPVFAIRASSTTTFGESRAVWYALANQSAEWLEIDQRTGVLLGVAPQVEVSEEVSFTVKASDGVNVEEKDFTLSVSPVHSSDLRVRGFVVLESEGSPLQRLVRAYYRASGALLGAAYSDDMTGEFEIYVPSYGEYTLMAFDEAEGVVSNPRIVDHVFVSP